MRGKLVKPPYFTPFLRITPAHAGKTASTSTISTKTADHPRACGENEKVQRVLLPLLGSPPRMRGKRLREHIDREIPRITPAHAGKTDHYQ